MLTDKDIEQLARDYPLLDFSCLDDYPEEFVALQDALLAKLASTSHDEMELSGKEIEEICAGEKYSLLCYRKIAEAQLSKATLIFAARVEQVRKEEKHVNRQRD